MGLANNLNGVDSQCKPVKIKVVRPSLGCSCCTRRAATPWDVRLNVWLAGGQTPSWRQAGENRQISRSVSNPHSPPQTKQTRVYTRWQDTTASRSSAGCKWTSTQLSTQHASITAPLHTTLFTQTAALQLLAWKHHHLLLPTFPAAPYRPSPAGPGTRQPPACCHLLLLPHSCRGVGSRLRGSRSLERKCWRWSAACRRTARGCQIRSCFVKTRKNRKMQQSKHQQVPGRQR